MDPERFENAYQSGGPVYTTTLQHGNADICIRFGVPFTRRRLTRPMDPERFENAHQSGDFRKRIPSTRVLSSCKQRKRRPKGSIIPALIVHWPVLGHSCWVVCMCRNHARSMGFLPVPASSCKRPKTLLSLQCKRPKTHTWYPSTFANGARVNAAGDFRKRIPSTRVLSSCKQRKRRPMGSIIPALIAHWPVLGHSCWVVCMCRNHARSMGLLPVPASSCKRPKTLLSLQCKRPKTHTWYPSTFANGARVNAALAGAVACRSPQNFKCVRVCLCTSWDLRTGRV